MTELPNVERVVRPEEGASLAGRTVLVAGATGGIGEGLTRALLRAGATVVAVGRSHERLTGLGRYAGPLGPDRLVTVELDVGQPDSAAVRGALADRFGRLDGVVIAIATGARRVVAPSSRRPTKRGRRCSPTISPAHFRALRALTPLLVPTGALVHLSGLSADLPYPGAALVGATNAAKKSLVRSLAAELGDGGPRIYELVIGPIRTRPRKAIGADSPDWLSAEDLGAHVVELIAGTSTAAGHGLQYLVDRASGVRFADG